MRNPKAGAVAIWRFSIAFMSVRSNHPPTEKSPPVVKRAQVGPLHRSSRTGRLVLPFLYAVFSGLAESRPSGGIPCFCTMQPLKPCGFNLSSVTGS